MPEPNGASKFIGVEIGMGTTQATAGTRHATLHVVLIVAVAAIGGFLFGFDTAVINGAVDSIRANFALGAFLAGFAVSCALLGSALGAWYAGSLADRYGRLRTMQVAAVLLAASAVGAGLTASVGMLMLWRVVGGIGVGVASVVAPTYIAEVAPAGIRGRLGSMQQLAIVLGIFVALLSDAWLSGVAGGPARTLWAGLAAWRWMFLVALVPAAIYFVLVLLVPESPRYLVARERLPAARAVLGKVLGLAPGGALEAKLQDIRQSLRLEHRPRLSDLLAPGGGLLPIVWVGIALSVFQQFVGINVIFYYSNTLWHSVGFSQSNAFAISVATSILNVLVTLLAIALVDRIGRKPLLLIGSAGMAVTLALMAGCFSQASGSGDALVLAAPWSWIALASANAYVVFFGVSWGPVVWVLLGEMFPNRIRAMALAVGAAAQWLANFLITLSFPPLAHLGLAFAYGLYAAFAVLSFVFVARAVRETKGIELEDMRGA